MWGRPAHHACRKEIASGALLGPRLITASPIIDAEAKSGSTEYGFVEFIRDEAKMFEPFF